MVTPFVNRIRNRTTVCSILGSSSIIGIGTNNFIPGAVTDAKDNYLSPTLYTLNGVVSIA